MKKRKIPQTKNLLGCIEIYDLNTMTSCLVLEQKNKFD